MAIKEENINRPVMVEKRLGDSAVDGLLAGVAAGLVMALALGVAGLAQGEGLAHLFRRFAPGAATSAAAGFLAHVAVSAIYGLIFALLLRALPRRRRRGTATVALGVAYGLVLLLLAQFVVLPRNASSLQTLPPGVLAAGHMAYGLALGWLLARGKD